MAPHEGNSLLTSYRVSGDLMIQVVETKPLQQWLLNKYSFPV